MAENIVSRMQHFSIIRKCLNYKYLGTTLTIHKIHKYDVQQIIF